MGYKVKRIYVGTQQVRPVIHVTGISLNQSSIKLTTAGQTSQLTATITPSDATNKNVTWTSSNTSIATVSSTGLVTCVTPGSCTITATTQDGGYTATCGVTQPKELCFTANTAGSTIKLNKVSAASSVTLETSRDGTTWSTYTFNTAITLSNIGDKVYWRNTSTTDTQFGTGTGGYYQFVMTGSINGSGNVNYLLNKNSTTTASGFCFNHLFYNCTSLKRAPSLPATTLARYCYSYMFAGCTGLTTVPALPATTLAERCYNNMFNGCTNLYSLPKLPATTLADYCYMEMFAYCSSIALSTTQTGYYQTPYRIPISGTGTSGTNSLNIMFSSTGGTFKGTPSINTTYYTFNGLV